MYEKHDTSISNGNLFARKSQASPAQNSKSLFRFFGKLVIGFAKLNFRTKILHGNVNSDTILVRYKDNNEIDPIISDFSLALLNEEEYNTTDGIIRYEGKYRCPELVEKIKTTIISHDVYYEYILPSFLYSNEFVEDVYAIGHLIEQTLLYQSGNIESKQCETQVLRDMAANMKRDKTITADFGLVFKDIKTVAHRPNMKQALQGFIEKVEECTKLDKDPLNLNFINDGRALLEELGKEKPNDKQII